MTLLVVRPVFANSPFVVSFSVKVVVPLVAQPVFASLILPFVVAAPKISLFVVRMGPPPPLLLVVVVPLLLVQPVFANFVLVLLAFANSPVSVFVVAVAWSERPHRSTFASFVSSKTQTVGWFRFVLPVQVFAIC